MITFFPRELSLKSVDGQEFVYLVIHSNAGDPIQVKITYRALPMVVNWSITPTEFEVFAAKANSIGVVPSKDVDFGAIVVNCSYWRTLQIFNGGAMDIEISIEALFASTDGTGDQRERVKTPTQREPRSPQVIDVPWLKASVKSVEQADMEVTQWASGSTDYIRGIIHPYGCFTLALCFIPSKPKAYCGKLVLMCNDEPRRIQVRIDCIIIASFIKQIAFQVTGVGGKLGLTADSQFNFGIIAVRSNESRSVIVRNTGSVTTKARIFVRPKLVALSTTLRVQAVDPTDTSKIIGLPIEQGKSNFKAEAADETKADGASEIVLWLEAGSAKQFIVRINAPESEIEGRVEICPFGFGIPKVNCSF